MSHSEASKSINIPNGDRLNAAAKAGDINSLYALIQENPHILEQFDDVPFVDTPLHFAASAGKIQFATEIMRLKPSLARKLNQEGFSPIDLALQHSQKKMVLGFVKINKDLVRVQAREGRTPLHFVSQIGEIHLLDKFLEACPDSIEDVTVRSETALHIALKYKQYEALEKLVLWLTKKKGKGAKKLENKMLNWGDEAGNTVLHISAINNDLKAVQLLIKSNERNLNAKNSEDLTAIDIAATEEIKSILKPSLLHKLLRWPQVVLPNQNIRKVRQRMDISEDIRNALLVVVTVVATATYQAALSPPGGLYEANTGTNNNMSHLKNNNISTSMNWKPNIGIGGNSIMSKADFILFSTTNMLCFMASTFAIIFLIPTEVVWAPLVHVAVLLLQMSYTLSMMVISPAPFTTNLVSWIEFFCWIIFFIFHYI